MAAPTYFHSASNPADNGSAADASTLAVTPPGSMVSGDLVVLVGQMQVATTGQITVSATGGQTWSSVSEAAANDQVVSVFWCQYNGTWSADPSLAFASQSGTQPATAVMHVFRPSTVGTWVLDTAFAGGAEASASPTVITGITPNKRDNVVLAGWAIPNASTWGTLSGTGWVAMETAQWRNTSGSDQSITFAHQLQGANAATNNVSQVPSTAAAGVSFIMAWSAQLSPTVVLNSPADASSGSDTTPTLDFTGTDSNGDDIEYNVQISDSSGFSLDDTIDQQQTDGASSAQLYGGTGGAESEQAHGQSFTAGSSYSLERLDVILQKINSPTDNVTVTIMTGSITGTVVGTSDAYDGSTIPGTETYVPFTFSTPVSITSGVKYYFIVERSGARDTTNYYRTYISLASSYAGGGKYSKANNAWGAESGSFDMKFKTFIAGTGGSVLLNKLSVTPDAGFVNPDTGGDTHPFNSGENIQFTVQAGDALAPGTYYWRVAGTDPSGNNSYGAWATTRTFTIATASMPNKIFQVRQSVQRSSHY